MGVEEKSLETITGQEDYVAVYGVLAAVHAAEKTAVLKGKKDAVLELADTLPLQELAEGLLYRAVGKPFLRDGRLYIQTASLHCMQGMDVELLEKIQKLERIYVRSLR